MTRKLPKYSINFFVESVKSLNINENKALLNPIGNLTNPVDIELKKFESHPSIPDIKEHLSVETKFSFSKVDISDIKAEIKNLDTNNACAFSNIPAKQLIEVGEIIVGPLMAIWNNEVIDNMIFPSILKYADFTPIFKKFGCVLKENYRPISILPVVSKMFERIMQRQMKIHIDK